MSKSKTDAAKSRTAVGEPGAGTGSTTRADRDRTTDGITITRWNLGLSLTIALTVMAGTFSLLWERTNALHDTQIQLVSRVSGLEARVSGLESEVRELRLEMRALREEVRSDITDLREEMRAGMQELADLIRARETPGDGRRPLSFGRGLHDGA
ncbi:hypothetical protein [Candidatus Palauibacter sp.]|uniref:hypothetical protein n=1 Tax=Candidatus Palauibacter sp. TaxID=3101350 RepID=UPI003B011515